MPFRLSGLDSTILLVSFAGAVSLWFFRRSKGTPSPPGQGLFDMLGIWTTIELVMIAASSFEQSLLDGVGVNIPPPAELIKNNGVLFPISIAYCAILVAKSTFIGSFTAAKSAEKETGL